ncbi:TPA: hypothetical protein ACIFCR_002781 [Acinetobacter baumannii]
MSNEPQQPNYDDDFDYQTQTQQPVDSTDRRNKFILIGAVIFAICVLTFMFISTKMKKAPPKDQTMEAPAPDQTAYQPPPQPVQMQPQQPVGYSQNSMVAVPETMPKSTDPVNGTVMVKDMTGKDVDAYSVDGQNAIIQFNNANGLQPIPLNMPAPVAPNINNQANNFNEQRVITLEQENSQLKAQNNSLRTLAQDQQLKIGQYQALIKNARANNGANIVQLRETKKGVALNKALPRGQEVVATVGNRVWLSDGKQYNSYGVGQRLPTGYRVLDVNEMAGEASFK